MTEADDEGANRADPDQARESTKVRFIRSKSTLSLLLGCGFGRPRRISLGGNFVALPEARNVVRVVAYADR